MSPIHGMHPAVSSKEIQKARQMAKRSRTAVACVRCKAAKSKCSDYRPCKQCVNSNSRCAEASKSESTSKTSFLPLSGEHVKMDEAPCYVKANILTNSFEISSYFGQANPHASPPSRRESSQDQSNGPMSSYPLNQIAINPFGHHSVQSRISSPGGCSFARFPAAEAQFMHYPSIAPPPSVHPATLQITSFLPPALSMLLQSSVRKEGLLALPMLPVVQLQPIALQMLLALNARSEI